MTLRQQARNFYALLAAISERAARDARSVWNELDPQALSGSWTANQVGERLFLTVSTAQLTAARAASQYVTGALLEQGGDPLGDLLFPDAFAGIASDGRDLESLLFQPVIRSIVALDAGVSVEEALSQGENALSTIANTQVSDMGRAASDVATVAEPEITGKVRMLVPPSCGRCAILAGRFYRFSEGFLRHENCDCIMIPSVEDAADDLRTDPAAYFESLTSAEQDKYFTKAGAEAIRQGADISQVVNARRGASGLSQPGRLTSDEQKKLRGGGSRGRLQKVDVFGRQLEVTSEGTTVRGVAGKRLGEASGFERPAGQRLRRAKTPRLMPEAILQIANGDRDEAVRLFKRFGYIS